MRTPAHDAWIKDLFGLDPASYDPGGGSAGPPVLNAASGPPAAPIDPKLQDGSLVDQSKLNFPPAIELQQLKRDVAATRVLIDKALLAEGDLYGIAANTGVDLAKPQDAADKLKKSAAPLSKQDRAEIEQCLNQINAQRGVIENIFHQMEAARESLAAAIDQQQQLPDQVAESPDHKGWAEAGDVLEHIWDYVNTITSAGLDAPIAVFMHALAGTDVLKDTIKGLPGDPVDQLQERVEALEQQVEQQRTALNSVIDTLKGAAAQAAKNATLQLTRTLDDYMHALHAYANEVATCAKLFAGVAARKPGGGRTSRDGGQDAARIISAYQAVLDAAGASQMARSALLTHTLSPRRYKYWADLLVPLGTPVFDAPDTPDSIIAEDMIVYAKGGRQNLFRETRNTMEDLSTVVGRVAEVYDSGAKLDTQLDAWSKAMKAVIGL